MFTHFLRYRESALDHGDERRHDHADADAGGADFNYCCAGYFSRAAALVVAGIC